MKRISKSEIVYPRGDYALIDSGQGEKLERYGKYVLQRPDPQAVWPKNVTATEWQNPDAIFKHKSAAADKGTWTARDGLPGRWPIVIEGFTFEARLSPFKHTGVFPEHASTWNFIRAALKSGQANRATVLNLFGYTGGATIAALAAGAEVAHVDASKSAVNQAAENVRLCGFSSAPVRWIVEDAAAFVKRELRRERSYDGIVMDPPSFGRGSKGEVWKIEAEILSLVRNCVQLLSKKPAFLILNGYAAGYSAEGYANLLETVINSERPDLAGRATITAGELLLGHSGGKHLPAGIFARVSF